MLRDVQTGDLLLRRDPQADGVLQNGKDNGDHNCHIEDNGRHAQTLDAEEMEAAAVEHAFFRGDAGGKQAGENGAESAADTVNGNCAHRVVDLGDLIKEFHSQHDDETEHNAHDGSAQRIYGVAPGGDAHQTGQRGVVSHGNIGLAVAQPGEDQGRAAGNGGAEVGVEEHQTGADDQIVGVHAHGGSAVEAEPAEPENEHAQRGESQVVAQNRLGLSVSAVLADPGAKHLGADQGAYAAHHVDAGGTGKIVEAQLTEPAAAPDPVAGDGVDQQGNGGGVDAVCAELGAFCHGTGDDGGGGGAEHGLENGVGPQGNAGGKDVAVVLHNHGVKPAEQAGACTEHDAEAHQPEAGGADAEVHQVLHQDVAGVFGTGEACFAHGEACLHEKDQRRAQQNPDGVD